MHMYEELKEMLCKELEEITRKGELTAGSLDTVDKLTHAIKSIDTIAAMEEYSNDYNYRGSYDRESDGMSSVRRRTYDGRSYARGRNAKRDSMGRYSRGGYSYDDAKDDMINDLHELMQDTHDERTKQEFKKFINKLETM
jgi:hypothetical protein